MFGTRTFSDFRVFFRYSYQYYQIPFTQWRILWMQFKSKQEIWLCFTCILYTYPAGNFVQHFLCTCVSTSTHLWHAGVQEVSDFVAFYILGLGMFICFIHLILMSVCEVSIIVSFCSWGNWGTESTSDLPEFTESCWWSQEPSPSNFL
jgi:hypothetical protein